MKDKQKDKKKKKNVKKKKSSHVISDKDIVVDKVETFPKSQPTIETANKFVDPSTNRQASLLGKVSQIGKPVKKVDPNPRTFPTIKIETQNKIDIKNDLAGKIKSKYSKELIKSPEKMKIMPSSSKEESAKLKSRSRCISLEIKSHKMIMKKRSYECIESTSEQMKFNSHSKSNEHRKVTLDFEAQNAKLKVTL